MGKIIKMFNNDSISNVDKTTSDYYEEISAILEAVTEGEEIRTLENDRVLSREEMFDFLRDAINQFEEYLDNGQLDKCQ